MIAKQSISMIQDEAQVCGLDPHHNTNYIVSDEHAADLSKVDIPLILSNQFEIDSSSIEYLPSGS